MTVTHFSLACDKMTMLGWELFFPTRLFPSLPLALLPTPFFHTLTSAMSSAAPVVAQSAFQKFLNHPAGNNTTTSYRHHHSFSSWMDTYTFRTGRKRSGK